MRKDNPLAELLVDDSGQLNKAELVKILKPYILIDTKSQQIEPQPPFRELKNELKVLLILAAAKARSALFEVEEKLSPSDIIKLDLMPVGSVKSSLKSLLDSRDIRADGSKYYLPNYKISQISSRLPNKN